MSKKKFVGVQSIDTVRVGKRTFAFGIYQDAKVGRVPFVGLAEKYPTDKDNPDRGRNFALGRAWENLGSQIQKREWNRLKRNDKPIVAKKLTSKEINEFANAPEAVKKRVARAAKNAKENTKANKSAAKKNTKVSKKSAGA